MCQKKNDIPVSSVLHTQASVELDASVKEDLEQDDPSDEQAKATFKAIRKEN